MYASGDEEYEKYYNTYKELIACLCEDENNNELKAGL